MSVAGFEITTCHKRDGGTAHGEPLSVIVLVVETLPSPFFKMRIEWHGLGVLAMAVSLTDSHGHPEDGPSVPPRLKKAMALVVEMETRALLGKNCYTRKRVKRSGRGAPSDGT